MRDGSIPARLSAPLDIVIVTWNAGPQLDVCLRSIAEARAAVDLRRVVIVDNASTDPQLLIPDVALPLTVIRNTTNRGFAAACNQGAEASTSNYLLFLNPDTRLDRDALSQPLRVLQEPSHRETGILGIQLVDAAGKVTPTCARFPTPGRFLSKMLGLDRALPRVFPSHFMLEWDHRSSRVVDQVMGAFFLTRREVFEALRGFDERFFVYFEEVDFALRARATGWQTFYLSTVQAYHRGGGYFLDDASATRLFYSLRSRLLYARKHFHPVTALLVALGALSIEPLSRLLLALAKRSRAQAANTVRAYRLLWQWLVQ